MPSDAKVATDDRTDEELIGAIARAREHAAFAELLRRHERAAFGLALRITANRQRADETVQDAMIRVWTSAASYRRDGTFKAWLLTIVAREALKAIKSGKGSAAGMEPEELTRAQDARQSPQASAETSELAEALRREVDGLPPLERQLIGLYFGGGLSQVEISKALSISQQTISYRLNEALRVLKSQLTATGYSMAIPLLAEPGFKDILCSGIDAPLGLNAAALSKLAGRQSIRAASGAHASSALAGAAGLAAAAVVVGGTILYSLQASPPQPAPPPALVEPAAAAAPEAKTPPVGSIDILNPLTPLADWRRRWTFENGPAKDLVLVQGDWTWNRGLKALDCPVSAWAGMPHTLPAETLMFVAKGRAVNTSIKITWGIKLFMNGEPLPIAESHSFDQTKKGHHIPDAEIRCYVRGRKVVGVLGGKVPGFWCEYDRELEGGLMILNFTNYSMDVLSVTPLKEADVPDFVKNPELLLGRN